jgi:hypothetical protein
MPTPRPARASLPLPIDRMAWPGDDVRSASGRRSTFAMP